MSARMPSRIFWSSPSTFAMYSLACEASCSLPSGFLVLLNAGDDAPGCTLTVDSVLVFYRQRIPFLNQKFRGLLSDPLQVYSAISAEVVEQRCSDSMKVGYVNVWHVHDD